MLKKHPLHQWDREDDSNYNLLVFYLKQGREIEFKYNGEDYFISHGPEGRALWQEKEQLSDFFNIDDDENLIVILNRIEIKNKSLINIFQNNEASFGTIF